MRPPEEARLALECLKLAEANARMEQAPSEITESAELFLAFVLGSDGDDKPAS